jgi:hypothetical protein
VLGTPIDTDEYIKDFVAQNSIKIMKDVEKLEPLTDSFNHVDTVIAKAILQKGTRGSFHHWVQDDYELAVTMLQKPHALGGFGLTPNVLAQLVTKVAMTSRFLKLVGSLPPEEQQLWLLLNLKTGYDILLNNHNCKVQEMYTVQDHPPSPNEFLLLSPLESLHKTHVRNLELPELGDSRRWLCHGLKTKFLSR